MMDATRTTSLVHALLAVMLFLSFTRYVSAERPTTLKARFSNTADLMYLSGAREEVIMNCSVSNLPNTDTVLTYEWMTVDGEGFHLLPANMNPGNQALVITMFSALYHTGDYLCQARTNAGRLLTSNNLLLRTRYLEVFPAKDLPVEVLEGAAVQLDCIVRSPPNTIYTTAWFKYSTDSTTQIMVKETVNGYTPFYLNSTRQEDVGTYVCFVKSMSGYDESKLELKIVAPAVFIQPDTHTTLSVGQQLSLHCDRVMSNGILTLSWHFNGSPISTSSRIEIVGDPASMLSITVNDITYADEGNYSCIASNLAGNTSQVNNIHIQGRPQVLGAGGTVDVIVHSTVVLNCFSIARPVHTAKIWRKNEEVLDFSSRNGYILLPNDSLVINNATRGDDAANFSCEVINDLGDDSISFTLTLIYLPGKPKNFTVIMERQESPSVTFSWTSPVELPGQPLEGYFLELRIEGSTGDVLTLHYDPNVTSVVLRDLLPGGSYQAQLYSYNRAGSSAVAFTSFQLPVTAPGLTLEVEALSDGRSLAIKWELLFDGGLDVEEFTFKVYLVKELKVQIYSVEPSIHAREHVISNLEPNTQYMVSVRIANNLKDLVLKRHVNTTRAPPGQPSSLDISLVTTHLVELSFSVVEGSGPITHFLLNTTSLTTSSTSPPPSQNMIAIDDQLYVDSLERQDGAEGTLTVQLVVVGLEPFTSYSFQVAAVSRVGVGEFSEATKPTQLEDGRILYFIVVSVVGGAAVVVAVVVLAISVMVCRSRSIGRRKRTFSINAGTTDPKDSFVLQSPPLGKISRGGTPGTRSLHSPTNSSVHDGPTLLVSDFSTTHNRHCTRSPSYDKLMSTSCSRTRADSLTGGSYCSVSVEKRPSVTQSENAVTYNGTPPSSMQQSHLYSSTGKMLPSFQNPTFQRHQLSLQDQLVTEPGTSLLSSPQEEQGGLRQAEQGGLRQAEQGGLRQASSGHALLLHQNSVDQHTVHLLSLPTATTTLSSSAPAINVRLSCDSMLEAMHRTNYITDV